MKKLLCSLFALATLATAFSQQTTPTKKEAEKAIKKDVQKLEDQRELRNKKIEQGKLDKAGDVQKDINKTRKKVNANKKVLKTKGVKTPVKDAKEQTSNK